MTRRLQDFDPLWPAEQRLVEWIRAGNMDLCPISDGLPPEDAPDDVKLRASFVRYLALGGCDECRVSEKGLRVIGAYIVGDGKDGAETPGLDLEGCDLPRDLALLYCRFPDPLLLRSASLLNLFLSGSHLHGGLSADRLEAKGGVFLRGLEAQGAVQLLGARLGGDLDCEGARLTAGAGGYALAADGLEAKGDVFLRGLEAQGEVRLLGVKLRGDLNCAGARVTAGVTGNALTVSRAVIDGVFVLRDGARVSGMLNLASSRIGEILDDEELWPSAGNLILNGCEYQAFSGGSPTSAEARLRWLELQDPTEFGDPFWPQPYNYLATYFADQGLDESAGKVLFEKEVQKRVALRRPLPLPLQWILGLLHGMHRYVNGFGYQPFRALWLIVLFALVGWPIYSHAWSTGAFRPSAAVILRSPEWSLCSVATSERVYLSSLNQTRAGRAKSIGEDRESQLACYLRQREGQSLPSFRPFFYSIDTIIPSSVLSLQDTWAPDERHSTLGYWARFFLWFQIAAGWALSFFAVAGFTRLRGD